MDKLRSRDDAVPRTFRSVPKTCHGGTRTTVVLRSGLQVDVRAVPEESYGAALLYFTGSKAHNIALRAIADHRGWKLNEYGLFSGKRRIAGSTEDDQARRGWLTADDIVNTKPLATLRRALSRSATAAA